MSDETEVISVLGIADPAGRDLAGFSLRREQFARLVEHRLIQRVARRLPRFQVVPVVQQPYEEHNRLLG